MLVVFLALCCVLLLNECFHTHMHEELGKQPSLRKTKPPWKSKLIGGISMTLQQLVSLSSLLGDGVGCFASRQSVSRSAQRFATVSSISYQRGHTVTGKILRLFYARLSINT
jgi:hypothetical protein